MSLKDVTPKDVDIEDNLPTPKPMLVNQQTMYGFRPQVSAVGLKEDIDKWQTVAIVMDGVFFRLYAVFAIISTVVILIILTSKYVG